MKLSSFNEGKFVVLIKETNNVDKINNFFMNKYWSKIENFVKLMRKVLMCWKNWSDFKGLRSVQEDWSKIETPSLNSQPEFRNYRIKSIVWMTREILQMLNQYTVDSHVPSQPAFFPPDRDPGRMLSRWVGMLSRNDKPPDTWDAHGMSGNTRVFFITLSRRIQSLDSQRNGTHITACYE